MMIITDAQVYMAIRPMAMSTSSALNKFITAIITAFKRNKMILMVDNGSLNINGELRLLFPIEMKQNALIGFAFLEPLLINHNQYILNNNLIIERQFRIRIDFVEDTYHYALQNRCGIIRFNPQQIKVLTPAELFQIKRATGIRHTARL